MNERRENERRENDRRGKCKLVESAEELARDIEELLGKRDDELRSMISAVIADGLAA